MPVGRPPPAPAIRRKPQTGLPPRQAGRPPSVMGAHLNYLIWLQRRKADLEGILEQELELNRLRNTKSPLGGMLPNSLMGSIRLRPDKDPLLSLDKDAIDRLKESGPVDFDPTRPAVAVSLEFLGAPRDLPPLGMIPAAQAGDMFFGWVNLERVAALAQHNAVVRIESVRTWVPTSDPAASHETPGNQDSVRSMLTGRGVRLAVVDLGFDFLHPAFVRGSGAHQEVRALWLHDMQLRPRQPAIGGALGLRISGEDLQRALDWYIRKPNTVLPDEAKQHLERLVRPPTATSSAFLGLLQQHGTAVVGLAAGNGSGGIPGQPEPPVGVAPEADLALIAIGAHDESRFADSTEVIAAFQAAFEDTSAPCVALMANSDNLGPHDGSLDGERFLDELLLLPGRAVVLSAGNLNHMNAANPALPPYHAAAQIDSVDGPPVRLVLCFEAGADASDAAEIWFHPSEENNARATISAELHANAVGEPIMINPFTVAESENFVTILSDKDRERNPGKLTVTALLQRDSATDAHCLRIVFRPARRELITKSKWTIEVAAKGPVHGWLDRNNEGRGRWDGVPAEHGACRTTLGAPAGAMRCLTVGSVVNKEGKPSDFSGRGPLRTPRSASQKPDLTAIGEHPHAPNGDPSARLDRNPSIHPPYIEFNKRGTSFAAPQVAGACALLFERFGPAATWADIRQAILQATRRPGDMPPPDAAGWDNACGHGLLNLDTLHSPPTPDVDVWLPKAPIDNGQEPFVDWTFWNSPAFVLEDSEGQALDTAKVSTGEATPVGVRVRLRNRGARPTGDITAAVWWAPLGAAYPLPHPETGGGAWRAEGIRTDSAPTNRQRLAPIGPGKSVEALFKWTPPREEGRIVPHLLIATADTEEDRYDPTDTACAQNNVALLSIAAMPAGGTAEFQILGTEDTDGLILWCEPPNAAASFDALPVRVETLPVTALPWRDARMFKVSGRRDRPLYDPMQRLDDIAVSQSRTLEGPGDISEITDVLNADRLQLQDGNVTIVSRGRLILPRLRLAPDAPLTIRAKALNETAAAIHMLHLSGGRRVGGGTIRIGT